MTHPVSEEAVPPAATARPLRKDAQRTRRLVLDAAKELAAERGVDVGFDEIAQRAGVGVGTVYRRFPEREDLIEALFAERVDEVLAIISAPLELEDPWEAVLNFCEITIVERQRDRGLAEILASGKHGRQVQEIREQMSTILDTLLQRAQEAGVVRRDLTAVDLAVMTHLLSQVTVGDDAEVWRRYLALFLDAIRVRDDLDSLPGPVPTMLEFEEIALRLRH